MNGTMSDFGDVSQRRFQEIKQCCKFDLLSGSLEDFLDDFF
jgi:hypothetical protein